MNSDAFFILGLFASLLLANALYRRSVAMAWGLLFAVSVPFIVGAMVTDVQVTLFTWVKAFSLIVGLAWVNILRGTKAGSRWWGQFGMWAILAVNILEAVGKEALDGFYVNAVCGLILIGTMPSWRHIHIDKNAGRDVLWPMESTWILAYTLWNFAFVYRFFYYTSSDHLAVLGASLVVVLFNKNALWVQARACALTVYVMGILFWAEVLGKDWPMTAMPFRVKTYMVWLALTVLVTMVHLAGWLAPRWPSPSKESSR